MGHTFLETVSTESIFGVGQEYAGATGLTPDAVIDPSRRRATLRVGSRFTTGPLCIIDTWASDARGRSRQPPTMYRWLQFQTRDWSNDMGELKAEGQVALQNDETLLNEVLSKIKDLLVAAR